MVEKLSVHLYVTCIPNIIRKIPFINLGDGRYLSQGRHPHSEVDRSKTGEECGIFQLFFDSMITNDARCTCSIEWRIAMVKAEFNKKKNFHQQTGLKLVKKKQDKRYIWNIALHGHFGK
jgi:hypothetical protein